jgi:hypothetical protein
MKVESGIEEELAGFSMAKRTNGNKQSDFEKEKHCMRRSTKSSASAA